jgi:peptide/nickel transport system substrate-binding protein
MKRTTIGLLLTLALIAVACGPAQTQPPAAATSAPAPAIATSPAVAPTAAPAAQIPAPTTAPAAPKPTKGGTFTEASFGEAVSLQPLITQDTSSSGYQGNLYAGLWRYNPETLDFEGVLYDGKPELSADGKTLTWKLKKNLKWSDGTPITSKDIIFTWQKMMDTAVKYPYRQLKQNAFTDVSAPDDYTVVYTLKTPGFCPAINDSGMPGPLPKHIYEKLDINQNDYDKKPTVFSGLYFFKEWMKDDHATFSPPNPGFPRGEAYINADTVRIVKDNTVATQMFKTQEVDVVGPNAIDFDEVSKLPFAQAFRYYSASASWVYIGFNVRQPILQDKRVRQAITSALNRDEMIKTIRLGYAKPQYSTYASSSWAYTDDLPKWPYDPAKAKQLLKDAGWTPGADGILQKDGKPFKVRLFYNAGNNEREKIAIISQQFLKEVGIQAEVISEEWNAYLNRVNTTRDLDMYIIGWSAGIEPNGFGNIWKSDGGQNATGYNNPEIDKLYNEAANVPGCKLEDRKKVYAKIQQILAEDQPYVFLWTNENLVVYNKRILNLNPKSRVGPTASWETIWINPSATK